MTTVLSLFNWVEIYQRLQKALAYDLLHCRKILQRPWHMFICILIKSFSSYSILWMEVEASWKRPLSSEDKWPILGLRPTLDGKTSPKTSKPTKCLSQHYKATRFSFNLSFICIWKCVCQYILYANIHYVRNSAKILFT